MLLYQRGSETDILTTEDLGKGIQTALAKLGKKKNVLVIPPDFTRMHSKAGEITSFIYEYYGEKLKDVLPALGTHVMMTDEQIKSMFKGVPKDLFREHNWRKDVTTVGRIPGDYISGLSNGKLKFDFPVQLNKLVYEGGHDLILSVGQVVPHEVIGMANYNKNLLIGTGGAEVINKSHFLGAVHGMEKIMGMADNPVRELLNYASEEYLSSLPVVYIHTVVEKDSETGKMVVRGLFIGDEVDVFYKAAELSLKVNFTMLDTHLKKVVVYLDPLEFQSIWLGNKSIYRTRMALADKAELIILAPGVKMFGEDQTIDSLIRKYGYRGTRKTLSHLKKDPELANNLSAAAHLIHGSSEERFNITYCPGGLSEKEIISVNYNYADLKRMMNKYNPEGLKEGHNTLPDGEQVFFISNPALGLWAYEGRFVEE